ncbi:flagellar hook-basal body complex protein FliE [Romboutsia sp.]|uniref:flagellar hook-basal body complex protein FliE n=1 Tax=Romboutsia sp. TaxID=1965302 RepID=UPI003F2A1E93
MPIGAIEGISNKIFTQGMKNIGAVEQQIAPNDQPKSESTKTNFENVLDTVKDGVYKVNDSQINANNKIEGFIKGEDVSMHEVMLSVQESQMSMQLMLEVRNKMYEAYQEVNRVQL